MTKQFVSLFLFSLTLAVAANKWSEVRTGTAYFINDFRILESGLIHVNSGETAENTFDLFPRYTYYLAVGFEAMKSSEISPHFGLSDRRLSASRSANVNTK